jgi:hypothetical protein
MRGELSTGLPWSNQCRPLAGKEAVEYPTHFSFRVADFAPGIEFLDDLNRKTFSDEREGDIVVMARPAPNVDLARFQTDEAGEGKPARLHDRLGGSRVDDGEGNG